MFLLIILTSHVSTSIVKIILGLLYSKVEDGIFCLPCVLFAVQGNCKLGKFVCVQFNQWSKKTLKFASHNATDYHKMALTEMEGLKSSVSDHESSIKKLVRQTRETDIARNRYVIKCIAEAILPVVVNNA